MVEGGGCEDALMQELKLSNVFISILFHFLTNEWVVYETVSLC